MKGINITDGVVIYNDMERGWFRGKTQPLWHRTVYHMWMDMWRRVYSNVHYFGSLIDPSFKYLSSYVKWIQSQPRFEEFCATCNTTKWSIDKDAKYLGNRDYYPEYMTLMLGSENSKEAINRNGTPMPKQPVIGIPLDKTKKIILAIGRNDISNYGFDPSHVRKCLNKKRKSHKDYKWFRVGYKHNKKYRVSK